MWGKPQALMQLPPLSYYWWVTGECHCNDMVRSSSMSSLLSPSSDLDTNAFYKSRSPLKGIKATASQIVWVQNGFLSLHAQWHGEERANSPCLWKKCVYLGQEDHHTFKSYSNFVIHSEQEHGHIFSLAGRAQSCGGVNHEFMDEHPSPGNKRKQPLWVQNQQCAGYPTQGVGVGRKVVFDTDLQTQPSNWTYPSFHASCHHHYYR